MLSSILAEIGTTSFRSGFPCMDEPLPILVENTIQIAWDYLERSGELGEPREAGEFLLQSIGAMIRKGERRKLMLTNKAISEYRRFRAGQLVA